MDILNLFRNKDENKGYRPPIKKSFDVEGLLRNPDMLITAKRILDNSIYVDRCIKENGKRISSLDTSIELNMNRIYADQEVFYAIYASMELEGYAIVWYDGRDLKVLDVTKVNKYLEKGYITYYKNNQTTKISSKEIVILHNLTPFLNVYGKSAITNAVRRIVNSYKDQESAVANFYKNGMFANAFISTDQQLTKRNYEELVTQIVEQFSGPENAGSIPIMHSGAEVKSLSLSPDQFKQLASDNVTLESIALAFEVPPLILGRQESGWDHKSEIMEFYINNTIIPKAKNLATQVDKFVLPLMGNRVKKFEFIYNNIPEVQEARRKMALSMEPLVRSKIVTINEVREQMGLKSVEWGNKPAESVGMNFNGLFGGGEKEEPKKEEEPEEEEPKEESKEYITKAKSIVFNEPKIWQKSIREDNHKRIDQFGSILRPKFRTVFKQMKKDTLEEIKGLKDPEAVKSIEISPKYLKKFKSLGRTYYPNLYYMAGQSVILAYKNRKNYAPTGVKFIRQATSFNMDDPYLQVVLEREVLRMAEDIYGDSTSLIRSLVDGAIREAREKGLGILDTMDLITNEIGGDMDGWMNYRSERIARTESMKINTNGSVEGARQNKMNAKSWLHSGAVRFRDSHRAMNPNHFIPLEAYFNVGGNKMFGPGDGPAKEVVNCGCSLLFDWRD